ncbi:hypothetical protein NECAME_02731 [Necator americanus]|uniref:Uncharacterized protein n=1 Tax=Necator americanus TaxID=51031 RepID=W2TCZ3_NECAM|nr:hypothetical protein NECAME_02731 [Necator americanus]ETN78867.1 hypothetical protein NECAME_02731 [Necator americanus]
MTAAALVMGWNGVDFMHQVILYFRKFVVEKLLMLAYVVVRNTEKESNPVSSQPLSKSKRPGLFDWSLRVTDASVFAIWFIIVWSVTSVTTMANQRFETKDKNVRNVPDHVKIMRDSPRCE